MPSLVSNGSYLYRRADSLVRTPIYKTITLAPDQMAYYPLCGAYARAGGDYSPGRGFVSQTGLIGQDHVRAVGKLMRKGYLDIQRSAQQGWWNANLRSPYFIFYQGQYGATAENTFCCEAYMQIPAYHFTIPASYAALGVASATLTLQHDGTIAMNQRAGNRYTAALSNGTYYAKNAPTNLVNSDSDWRNKWTQRIGIYSSLSGSIKDMHNAAYDDIVLDTDFTREDFQGGETWQTARYSPVLGNISLTYADDGIPKTFTQLTQNVTLSWSITNYLSNARSGWIVISPNVGCSSGDSDTSADYPVYNHSDWGRWLCCSFGDYALTVNLTIS